APGAELSFTNNTIIDLATYNYLIVVIDGSDELPECDETNNSNAILLCNELLNWFADTDGDNYGDPGISSQACNPPPGYVADSTDCDDTDPNIHPSAPEACDGLDNNCNGMGDEPVVDACGDCMSRWSATPAIEPASPELCLGTWKALSVDDRRHSSLQFGGLDGAAAFGNPGALQITGDLTIEMWLKPTAFGVRRNPINKAYGGEYTITQWENG
ncbi:MAG: putative metal-binding motif-containing protein, partial [Myxococcales bacterium]|nr:putative metal-binding motif-containing protein [Myxococcales bacterium]